MFLGPRLPKRSGECKQVLEQSPQGGYFSLRIRNARTLSVANATGTETYSSIRSHPLPMTLRPRPRYNGGHSERSMHCRELSSCTNTMLCHCMEIYIAYVSVWFIWHLVSFNPKYFALDIRREVREAIQ